MTYEVEVSALARVAATIEVEADSEAEAREKALQDLDCADWELAYGEKVYASDCNVGDIYSWPDQEEK